jgi:hypothetical protein
VLGDEVTPVGFTELAREHPGVRSYSDDGKVLAVYGVPMTAGRTADEAAAVFLGRHADAFGLGELDLRQWQRVELDQGKFTAFMYDQHINGVPVENGTARVLVSHLLGRPTVVFAGGRMADASAVVAGESAVARDDVIAVIAAHPRYNHLREWGQPELRYIESDEIAGAVGPVRAWKVYGGNGNGEAYEFFVSDTTGQLALVRSAIHHDDVTGTATGMASPGTLPDITSNPPVAIALENLQINGSGIGSTLTDDSGNFVFPNVTGTTTLQATLDGPWVDVVNNAGGDLNTSLPGVVPGVPAAFVVNSSPSALTTSQVNVFIHTNRTHDFITDRAPAFTALDIALRANANVNNNCNATFNSGNLTINFYTAGGGCVNTAYSTVISHEYGHFVVNRLGLSQGGFGEGYGDSIAMMINDTPIVGERFSGSSPVRSPGLINQTYPCSSGAIHTCGQILAGTWWDIRTNLGNKYGSAMGLALTQQLFVDWSMITGGGTGSSTLNSAHPLTAIEVLTVNDDDGNIGNGTPDYAEICDAFGQHNIDCPELSLVAFSFPNGLPGDLTPNAPTVIRVDVEAVSSTPIAGSGEVFYRGSGGSFTGASMTEIAPNEYEAPIPGFDCGDTVEFYFAADSAAGPVTEPSTAPLDFFSVPVADAIMVEFDDFESNSGWTVGLPGDTATTGIWDRANPQGTAAQPEDDHTPSGTDCWVTDSRAGSNLGQWDVDNGKTSLVSPVFDLSGAAGARVSWWLWYNNTAGASPEADTFQVDISDDGGSTWTRAVTVGPSGPRVSGGWFFDDINVADFVGLTDEVQLRFVAEDAGQGSIVEAALDDFELKIIECGASCYPDCDQGSGVGVLDVFDFLCFQDAFVSGDPYADCDGNSVFDVFDFLCFQDAFTLGCP